ncbi:MAG: hypothetical protein AB7F86_00935 [Bdellovibrionales bacterium]
MQNTIETGGFMKAERRLAARKVVDTIHVAELTSLSSYSVISREGIIVDASQSGFLVKVDRNSLVPKEYRENLNLSHLVGHQVVMYLPQMNLDLDGTITRADHVGKGKFEIAITFSPEVPEYWRGCLVDLLPEPGEMAKDDAADSTPKS